MLRIQNCPCKNQISLSRTQTEGGYGNGGLMPHRCPGSLPCLEHNVDRCLITLSFYGNTNLSLKRKSKTFRSLKKMHFFPFSKKNTLLIKLEVQAKADVRPILHLFCVMNVLSSYLWHYSLFANLKFNCEHPLD